MNQELSFIVVAGGSGRRMGSDIPKQYIELMGKPIFIHTLLNIKKLSPDSELILVVPANDLEFVREVLSRFDLGHVMVTKGGETRAESVFNGLQLAHGENVAVHDAVRPFITPKMFMALKDALASSNATVPAVKPIDSVRLSMDGDRPRSIDRNKVYMVQTPQCFKRSVLLDAYHSFFSSPSSTLTDDASIVEQYASLSPKIVEGDINNIKITTPKDLVIANYILERQ